MKEIPLTQGKVALVDDEDFEWLLQWKWHAEKHGRTWYARGKVNGKLISMHCIIMNTPAGKVTDHASGNGLDNRRDNLRVCTKYENRCNTRKHRDNSHSFKGTFRHGKNWSARIHIYGKDIHLGTYLTEVEAAHAYDSAAREIHGKFAHLNFPT